MYVYVHCKTEKTLNGCVGFLDSCKSRRVICIVVTPTLGPVSSAWKGVMSSISYQSLWHLVLFTLEANLCVN